MRRLKVLSCWLAGFHRPFAGEYPKDRLLRHETMPGSYLCARCGATILHTSLLLKGERGLVSRSARAMVAAGIAEAARHDGSVWQVLGYRVVRGGRLVGVTADVDLSGRRLLGGHTLKQVGSARLWKITPIRTIEQAGG